MSPRIKICGVTNVVDARRAVEFGADLIGLNFWPRSPRFVAAARAAEIAATVRGRSGGATAVVGVFVRESPVRIAALAHEVGLDLLQFHGDEDEETLAPFGERAIKALRWSGRPPAAWFGRYAGAWGFLLDRQATPGALPGGTGRAWDYAEAADLPTAKPVLLAGGIGPDNVRAALAAARPWGIDVCSRVESAPGVKDPRLLEALFKEARDGEAHSA